MTTRFSANHTGTYAIASQSTVQGEALALANYITVGNVPPESQAILSDCVWKIDGVKSHVRYTTKKEKADLELSPEKVFTTSYISCMIPIKKSREWWCLAQDERREIMEEQSKHFSIGKKYLNEIDRILYHSKDLHQEFDFVTWFNFLPHHENAFNDLVRTLRESLEWKYVVREVDIRMFRKV